MDYVGMVDGYLAKHPGESKAEAFAALEINGATYYNQRHRMKTKGKKHPRRVKTTLKRRTKGVAVIEAAAPLPDRVVAFVGSARSVRQAVDGWLI